MTFEDAKKANNNSNLRKKQKCNIKFKFKLKLKKLKINTLKKKSWGLPENDSYATELHSYRNGGGFLGAP